MVVPDHNFMVGKEEEHRSSSAKYPNYLPTWDPSPEWPSTKSFQHYEHAKDADPSLPDFLSPDVRVDDLTPATGSEVTGIQLSTLSSAAKDQLALLASQRKILAFRNQNFANLPITEIIDYCSYFGRPYVHPVGPIAAGHPEIHIAHSGGSDARLGSVLNNRITSMSWHIDGSEDPQPPGLVFLYMLEGPSSGGDTVFTNTAEAYRRLSPGFRKRLCGLLAEHSDLKLVKETLENGNLVRKEGIKSVHPIIRSHPVTGEKIIFVNPIYTTKIVGLKKEESDHLLRFLYNHIGRSLDCQVRLRWTEGTVVIFDNRATCHSAIFDATDNRRRHIARVALAAEKPLEASAED